MDINTIDRNADLPTVAEATTHRALNCGSHICAGGHHHRTIAAEFERQPLNLRATLLDMQTDRAGTSKGYFIDLWMFNQRLPNLFPFPVNTLTTPAGIPASRHFSAMASAV